MLNKFKSRLGILGLAVFIALSVAAPVQQAFATATVLPQPVARFFNAAGAPLAGGMVFTYAAGTTTPLASYTDSTALVQNTNPVVLDSTGSAPIWISGAYKIVLQDSNGVTQWTQDNIQDFFTYDNIQSTSTTSLAIANTASKTFTTQSSKYFAPGLFLLAVDTASPTTNWMHGQVTSYIGTQLIITTDAVAGSGTYADWTISLSGPIGPAGPTGPSGAGSGDMVGSANLAVGAGGVANAATARTNLGLGSSSTLDAGTGANQVVQRDGSAKYPAGDGSAITNLNIPTQPVVTNSASGKVVIGSITEEWFPGFAVSGAGYANTFPTAFSGNPYTVQCSFWNIASLAYAIDINNPTSSGFSAVTPGVTQPITCFAVGPT